jgi:methionine synthase II (cobalamin-independent)
VEVISEIPDWVRKTAKWWSLNQIADEEYSSGLQYLIEKNIIIVPIETLAEGSSEQQLPSWLRKDAGWWSQGSISDEEYFKSIQWMMNNNFIKTEFRLK